jgi:hypothetical protein
MTTKEIAKITGKTERSARNWINKIAGLAENSSVYMENSSVVSSVQLKAGSKDPHHPADFTQEETCAIIEAGLGKNAAGIYRANAQDKQSMAPSAGSSLTPKDIELVGAIVAAVIQKLDNRVTNIESRIEQRQALLPPPELTPRAHINMIVRGYAQRKNIDHGEAWRYLYSQFGYRTNSNPSLCAKHRGMGTLDYIETEGMIGTLEAVAIAMYEE